MRGTWKAGLGVAVAMLLAIGLIGCSELLRDEVDPECQLRLIIESPAGSRAIGVAEFEVTSMIVRVYDPSDALVQTIAWDPMSTPGARLVTLSGPGRYELEVTHIADNDGDPVEATERVSFMIRARRITVITIVPGMIGVIDVDNEDGSGPMDGTITVRLEGADEHDGKVFVYAVFEQGADFWAGDPSLAWGVFEIADGGGEGGTVDGSMPDPQPVVVFSGGETYDLFGVIHASDFPAPGNWITASPIPVYVDGDVTVTVVYPDDFEPLDPSFYE